MGDEGNVIDATRKMSIRKLLEQPPAAKPAVETPPRPAGSARKAVEEPERPQTERLELVGGLEFFDPDPADYKAYGWAGNKTLPSLCVIRKDGVEQAFAYADLATAYPDGSQFVPSVPGSKGSVIMLRFSGDPTRFLLIIEGLRLRLVWQLLIAHKTPWIQELPTGVDFVSDTEPVIRSITVKTLA